MSTESLEHVNPEPEHSDMGQAIQELDLTQKNFFSAAASWVKAPSADRAEKVRQGQIEISQHFATAAQAVLRDELETDEVKAGSLVTLFYGIDSARVEAFSGLVKKGDFSRMPVNDDFQEKILESIKAQEEPVSIAGQLAHQCVGFMQIDVNELFKKAPRARLLNAAKSAGWHALDGAKISAAVVVGSVIAQKISKK